MACHLRRTGRLRRVLWCRFSPEPAPDAQSDSGAGADMPAWQDNELLKCEKSCEFTRMILTWHVHTVFGFSS